MRYEGYHISITLKSCPCSIEAVGGYHIQIFLFQLLYGVFDEVFRACVSAGQMALCRLDYLPAVFSEYRQVS